MMGDTIDINIELGSRQQEIQECCFHPSNAFVEFAKDEVEQSIFGRFEHQVKRWPNRIAVKSKHYELTYDLLNQVANRVAHTILAQQGSGEEPIALLLENDAPMIAAILGGLKAGKFYVTLDPLFPASRLRYMLDDSQAELIVANNKTEALATELAQNQNECRVINIDEAVSESPTQNPGLEVSPDAVAYIIYTSGSTGQPKGIVYNHRSVLLGIRNYTNAFHICINDRLTLLHSCSFSSSMVDIFCALLNGAAVYPWDVKLEGLVGLADWLTQERITLLNWVPTPFRYFVETLSGEIDFPDLRLLVLASEPVSRRDVDLYKKHFSSDCIFVNRLGTTETYNFSLYFVDHESRIDTSLVPAGYAVPDKQVLLLDDTGQEVGFDTPGEIVIRSAYLALGYWRRPELTRQVFQPDPAGGDERIYRTGDLGIMRPDGCLEYLGRRDFQVKVRGYRVEPAEVEMVLVGLDAIREAVVVAKEEESGEKSLIAYFVSAVEPAPTVGVLRDALLQTLPDYMIPAVFVRLDALPLTPTGKLDRRALPAPDLLKLELARAFVAPRDEVEWQLAEIWGQVLGVQSIGVKDNFFELGGHSMLAARLMVEVGRIFDRKLPLSTLFQFPTIERLADVLRKDREDVRNAWSPLVTIRSTGSRPPFFCLPGNLGNVFTDLGDLARYLGPDQPFYGLQDSMQNPTRIETLAAYYLDEIRRVQPEGPYLLGGVCSGGVVAFEMAQQLEARKQQVAFLALVEPARPWRSSFQAYSSFVGFVLSRFTQRFGHHSRNVSQLGSAEQGAYLRLKLKLVANVWALRHYAPRPYSGDVDLFLSSESLQVARNPQLRWRELAIGETRVHEVPGTHDTITGNNDTRIAAASMKALAEQLGDCMDRALAR